MKRGFTIVELVIVMAIIALIGGMVGIRFLRTNAQNAVKNSALALSAAMEEARSRTVSGQTSGTGSSWGVFIDPAASPQALLFVDTDGDGVYSVADTSEEINLDDATQLVDCSVDGTGVSDCGVVYESPGGMVSFFSSSVLPPAPQRILHINLESVANTSIQANVRISAPAGLVTSNVIL